MEIGPASAGRFESKSHLGRLVALDSAAGGRAAGAMAGGLRRTAAPVITTTDDDVVRGLLRVAREQNATQLVVGKPAGWRMLDLVRGGSFLNRLIRESGHVDVHAVRAEGEEVTVRRSQPPRFEITD